MKCSRISTRDQTTSDDGKDILIFLYRMTGAFSNNRVR